jgi:hypothetical protein
MGKKFSYQILKMELFITEGRCRHASTGSV